MKRPLVYATLQFILGILIGKFLRISNIPLIIAMFIVLLSYFVVVIFFNETNIPKLVLPLVIIMCGVFAMNISISFAEGTILEFVGNEIVVEGIVIEDLQAEETETTYKIKTNKVIDKGKIFVVNGNIQVKVKNNSHNDIYRYGDILKIKGTISLPSEKRNPGGFNYKEHLLGKGICANLYTFSNSIEYLGNRKTNPLKIISYKIKEKVINKIEILYPDDVKGILAGIILGAKSEIPDFIIESFIKSGIYHILAVSGLHVGYIVAVLLFVVNRFQYRPIGLVLASIGILLYILIVGAKPSVIRAGIMSIITIIGLQLGKETDSLTNLSIAAFVILVINPLSLFTPGFQLSFGATTGIIVLFANIKETLSFLPKSVGDVAGVTISAQLGVLPFLLYYFGEVSIVCIFTNLIVLPLIGTVIILGIISIISSFIFVPIGIIIGTTNSILLKLIIHFSIFFSKLPFSTIKITSPSVIIIVLYYLIIYSLIRRNKNIIIFIVILITVNIWYPILVNNNLEVTFIDVGQGDAIYIKTPKGKNLMIDSGGLPDYYEGDFDTGKDIILPFLRHKKAKKLDVVFISHIHDDHIKGFIPVSDEMKIDYFIQAPQMVSTCNYDLLKDELSRNQTSIITMSKGEHIKIEEELEMYILHPDIDWIKKYPLDLNDNSMVIMMRYRDVKFLFTGDIESMAEHEIVKGFGSGLKTDVLKVAHHGSITSTTESFIKNAEPQIAVISVGQNSFGHPHEDIINRIEAVNGKIFRTDMCGAITVITDGNKIIVKQQL